MDFKEIENKLIALLVWNVDKENDVHVYIGQITKEDIDFIFKNEMKGWKVQLQADTLEKIKK